jgi:flavin-dependent dehydrogenase
VGEMTDVFVVGGGPAGLAAAIAARKHGLRVMVADADEPPIDKTCGEGLLPDSVDALARLGVVLRSSDGYRFRGIQFFDGAAAPRAYFPVGPGRGVRRKVLHERLVKHASHCGVRTLWRARVTGLNSEGLLLDGTRVRARWIVGADGTNSLVRRWSGLDCPVQKKQRFAYRRHYRVRPWTDCVEVYWGRGLQVYVTPVGPTEVCAAVVSRDPRLRLREALGTFPVLAARLGAGEPTSMERGGITSMLKLPRVCRGRVALIGDASRCVDAITGEGLGLAFKQAWALAEALAANDLREYEAAHRELVRRAWVMAKFLLTLDRRPAVRERVTLIFERQPQLFARFVAAHLGAVSGVGLFAAGASLGWHMLTV